MITEIDGKVAIVDKKGYNSCKESMYDLREGLIHLMYAITTADEVPIEINYLAEMILIMGNDE